MEKSYRFEMWYFSVVTIVILGILGNSLSLISILYATYKKNHNFGPKRWLEHSVFIFSLALVDLGACILVLAACVYATIVYWVKEQQSTLSIGDSHAICKFFILGIQDLAQITGWSIALISFVRILDRCR